MKRNKILKSLADLSPELLGAEAAKPEQTNPQQTQVVTQVTQPSIFPTGSDTRGHKRWGINE
jgi:hypothetical protein